MYKSKFTRCSYGFLALSTIVVSFVFLISATVKLLSFMIKAWNNVSFCSYDFDMYRCHVAVECSKPKHLRGI